jgi:nucleoside-diphosphate-sugar epimerase
VTSRLVLLGGGFTGAAVARRALADGARVAATTRDRARVAALEKTGVEAIVLPTWTAEALAAHVDEATRVVVTFPPDGVTDRAVAKGVARAAAVVYVSSTGVYGDVRGRVDDDTPARGTSARATARLEAEAVWRDVGAVVVRAPGIYGPERGVHVRLARGTFRIPGDGTSFVSRIHVDDLAATLWALAARGARDATFVTGDAEPATHLTVVEWLCRAMRLPLPPHAPLEEVDETLRNDRRVDGSRLQEWVGLPLAYPTYREGFAQCLRAAPHV